MIWNEIKKIIWCGVFHKPKVTLDLGYPDLEPTEKDIGKTVFCVHCWAYSEVI